VYMSILSPFPTPHGATRGFFNSLLGEVMPMSSLNIKREEPEPGNEPGREQPEMRPEVL
jgi:hypothetical protein